MTVTRNVAALAEILAEAGVEEAQAEAEILAAEFSGKPTSRVTRYEFSESQFASAQAVALRRGRHEPLQYILGHAPFMDLDLEVNTAVLIPRPETEILCEHAVARLPRGGALLDAGTGSGAIALAVAYARPDTRVLALDVSPAALEVAERNRAKYHLPNVTMLHSDLSSALPVDARFDFIAANLPYVSEEEFARCAPEITEYEPKLALLSDDAGLALEKRAALEFRRHLAPGGELWFEFSPEQSGVFSAFLAEAGYRVRIVRDYCGRDRFAVASLPA